MKVITTHRNADFDSLSSMVAARKLYPDAILAFPGSQEKTLRDFLIQSTLYLFDIAKMKQINYEAIDTLILVDTRQKGRIGEFARVVDSGQAAIHIYDHHPPSHDDVRGDVEVLKTTGATATILVSILREKDIEITSEEASVMMLGIYEETGSFQYPSTTVEDLNAVAFLLTKGASVNLVSDMLIKELTPEQVALLNDLINSFSLYNINGIDIIISEVSSQTYVGDLAVIVHKFRDMQNINVIFAMFSMEDRIYIIGRSRIPEVDAGHVLSLLGGGGHREAASCTVREMTLVEAKDKLLQILRYNVKPLWKAKDIMFFPVKSVDAESPLHEATALMVKYNINAVPVTSDDRVVGIITRQIGEKAAFHKLQDMPVKEYMLSDFKALTKDDSIEKVKEIIIGDSQRFLPVTHEERLIGAITRTDLLRVLQDEIAKSLSSKMEFHEVYHKRKNVRRLMEEWLDEQAFTRLVDIGRLAGRMGYHAYLVGGFVRDLLLRIDNYDVDIVIEGDGIRFSEEMAREFGVKVRPHKEFGTAKLIYPDKFKLDIATARLEYYKAPAALPVVEHGSLKLDLYRRDFAINTLAISLNKNTFGELIDFFGGQRDLKEKTIRVLHSLSFVEDPTRVFRAIRFEHRFGFHIGKQTLNLIRNAVKMNFLAKIRGRRIWTELSLILLENEPERILKRLNELDLLRFISDRLVFNKEKEALFHQMLGVLNWYDLLYRGKPAELLQFNILGLIDHMKDEEIVEFCRITEMSERLRNSTLENARKARSVIFTLLTHSYTMKKSGIYRLFEDLSLEALLFVMARAKSEEIKRRISSYITLIDTFKPHVTGRDLKKMGIPEGPAFKTILTSLKEAKIDLDLKTREEEIGFVKDFVVKEGIC
jgi:tRNA nucleotidyltransferase (CCA-adding enzyme)